MCFFFLLLPWLDKWRWWAKGALNKLIFIDIIFYKSSGIAIVAVNCRPNRLHLFLSIFRYLFYSRLARSATDGWEQHLYHWRQILTAVADTKATRPLANTLINRTRGANLFLTLALSQRTLKRLNVIAFYFNLNATRKRWSEREIEREETNGRTQQI